MNDTQLTVDALANILPSGENLRCTTGEDILIFHVSFQPLSCSSSMLLLPAVIVGELSCFAGDLCNSKFHNDIKSPPTRSCEPKDYRHNIINMLPLVYLSIMCM